MIGMDLAAYLPAQRSRRKSSLLLSGSGSGSYTYQLKLHYCALAPNASLIVALRRRNRGHRQSFAVSAATSPLVPPELPPQSDEVACAVRCFGSFALLLIWLELCFVVVFCGFRRGRLQMCRA